MQLCRRRGPRRPTSVAYVEPASHFAGGSPPPGPHYLQARKAHLSRAAIGKGPWVHPLIKSTIGVGGWLADGASCGQLIQDGPACWLRLLDRRSRDR